MFVLKDIVRHFNVGFRFSSSVSRLKCEIDIFDGTLNVTAARTPPGSWYVDEQFYELEKRTVFGQNWVGACGAHHLKQPGDFVTGFIGDEPYLISKDRGEKLNYLYNICRHHGTLLCDDAKGRTDEFVCPYHSWTYALDGRLTMAKRLRTIENFTAKDNCLKQFPGANWFGCLFLNQRPQAEEKEFYDRLSTLHQRITDMGCHSDKLTHVGSAAFPQVCNWKVVIDNYLDGGYHVPICHKALSANLKDDSYTVEVHPGFSIQSCDSANSESRVGQRALFAHIYPNVFFNRYGYWVDVNYVLPTGPQTSVVMFDWYMDTDVYEEMPPDEREKTISDNLKDSSKVQDEDTEICERVQKGMRSKSFTYGRYAPLIEHAMYDFHRRLAEDYKKYEDLE